MATQDVLGEAEFGGMRIMYGLIYGVCKEYIYIFITLTRYVIWVCFSWRRVHQVSDL